ncbi:MAG TPA: hypothetical protein VGX93_07070, partial [Chthoniobacterales bacterium]|nr:hypothetical protein [Chthoniobacterales bacterium]
QENGGVFHWGEHAVRCDVSRTEAVGLTLSSGATLEVDMLLVAGGRKSNTEEVDLSAAGLNPEIVNPGLKFVAECASQSNR